MRKIGLHGDGYESIDKSAEITGCVNDFENGGHGRGLEKKWDCLADVVPEVRACGTGRI